ncbi:16S rRNA (uracil(1498)-N(3))-methyltransferase [Caldibacillus lycopersici]|uniref:Ribosomal RNA small subunit methyltransferase E n=1 Tax=Perspicuibacillus lycopersici TaxID=1325689 RepID=A0AAE3LQW7_9BACI|nr:16S rRNA (uracil(1498)-N(3))-methyltransferase [Perspicuibacillus lycopersici]MCU9613929.1 16S rRNA (uracil(1498)-N(3))-methyltransferase [Perspicuibacillus lycopersici]
MQRYFLENNIQTDAQIQIIGEDYHHIVRVMRMTVGDMITVVFPNGKVAICEISDILSESVLVDIKSWETVEHELPIHVTIASGLLKGDKLDIVIQKGTELGASQFLPFASDRSIVKLDEKKSGKKLERWRKIAKEAAEQSERNRIPTVEIPSSFQDLINMSKTYTTKIVAYEESARENETSQFSQTLQQLNTGDSLFIIFGPEGGLTPSEVNQLQENDFIICGLGPRILRAETAPMYCLSAISFYYELQR